MMNTTEKLMVIRLLESKIFRYEYEKLFTMVEKDGGCFDESNVSVLVNTHAFSLAYKDGGYYQCTNPYLFTYTLYFPNGCERLSDTMKDLKSNGFTFNLSIINKK